jgi:hypothetical protein
MRRLIGLVACVAVIAVAYVCIREDNSARVKREILKTADHMELTPDERTEVRRYIERGHEAAYRRALDLTNQVGSKFDSQAYFDDLFADIIDHARSEGNYELADKITEEKTRISFTVNEK